MELINEKGLVSFIEKVVINTLEKRSTDKLTGRTINLTEFRKKYCCGKGDEWVRTKIFDRYPEVDFANGGWVINPRKTPNGKTTAIFEDEGAKWIAKHRHQIDWNEKL